jgi:tRNA threonylcarbamoyladenosine biosynthesis protein TsaE
VSPGLKLCEWPEKAHGFLPVPDLDIFIDVLNEHERAVRLQAHTTLGEGLLA